MDILLKRILSLIPPEHGGDKKFALSIGYKSGNVIADWKAGRSTSYKSKVEEISRTYGVSTEWLYGLDEQKEKPALQMESELSDAKRRLIERIISGSDDQADFVLGIIERMK